MTIRKTTSLTLLLSFIVLILTSLVLYVVPEGRVAYWSDWRWLWLSKSQWGDIHTNSGFLFLVAGLLHLLYNWKPIVSYLKNRAKRVRLFTPDHDYRPPDQSGGNGRYPVQAAALSNHP